MTNRNTESVPVQVPETAKQTGAIRGRWPWAEQCVWTERMLTALEDGVKGGKWFALIDKVYAKRNLEAAFGKVKANRGSSGVDHQTIESFERRLEENLEGLHESLRIGTYQPQRIRRVWIPKPGKKEKRPLGIPTVRDRVVQTALRNVMEPIFEKDFAKRSYGCRPGRGCKDALRRVDRLLKAGYQYVVDADLKSYFDSIPREPLMELVRKKIADGRVLTLVGMYLKQEIMESAGTWTPEGGTPQGAVISPLLANIYLDPLDHLMEEAGLEMVRYADDFVILCRTMTDAESALKIASDWSIQAGLTLHPEKTHIVDMRRQGGFDFLGYHFEDGKRRPRKKSLDKLKDTVRAKTKRTNGTSLNCIILDLNRTLKGWFEYFKHSRASVHASLDGWVRMRLRSILRKRTGLRGCGRGSDHQRWPNAFFTAHGLFSLKAAYVAAYQSSLR